MLNPSTPQNPLLSHTLILESFQDFFLELDIKPCGNKHFFSVNNVIECQTYQNYEQSRQKLGTFLENKVLQKPNFQKPFLRKVALLVQYS
jgi:hypothetical protein